MRIAIVLGLLSLLLAPAGAVLRAQDKSCPQAKKDEVKELRERIKALEVREKQARIAAEQRARIAEKAYENAIKAEQEAEEALAVALHAEEQARLAAEKQRQEAFKAFESKCAEIRRVVDQANLAAEQATQARRAAEQERQEAEKAFKAIQGPKEPFEVKAVCVVTPFEKSEVRGIVRFHQKGDTVTITGELTGLKPGDHGFHIHEFGDISGKDGLTTGGHYNPTKMPHGKPTDAKRHVGDLGNITADNSGKAIINMKDTVIRLTGPYSIIGRAVVIHHDADDFGQPVGHAGSRLAGGVIGIAK